MAIRSASTLHGRSADLEALRRCLDAAAAGRGQTAFVEGEAGIGKTRLVAAACADARRRGMRVVTGAADALERNRPFAPLVEALQCRPDAGDPARAEVGRLLASETHPGLQFRAVDALVGIVESEALRGPLVLVVEDLHWADDSTLLTIHAITRRLGIVPVVLLGTLRPAGRPDLAHVVQTAVDDGARHLRLGPLDEGAVAALVAEAVGAQPGPGLLAQAARAAGNPLYLTELVGALREDGTITMDDGRADVAQTAAPPTLRPTILRRIRVLPDRTLELLKLAAILGSVFSVADLAAVARRPVVELMGPLEEAQRAGVLVDDGERLRFRHDLLREAIELDIPPAVRAALHADAGRTLAARGADPLRVAEHLAAGAAGADPEAAGWLVRGARAVARQAPRTAAGLLRRALELLSPGGEQRDEVAAELASLCVLAGSAAEAERLARELLDQGVPEHLHGPLHLTIARALFTQGRWEELVLEAHAAAADSRVPAQARARLLAESCLGRLWCLDPDAARADGEEAVRLGRGAGDPLATSLGLSHLSAVSGFCGDLLEAVELADAGLAAATSDEARRRHPHVPLGITLMDVDRFDDARVALRAGMALGERLGTVWDLPIYHTLLAFHGLHSGAWDDAVAEAQAGLALGEEIGSHPVALAAHGVLATVAIHRHDLPRARQHVDLATGVLEASGLQWSLWILHRAQALLDEAMGDGATATAGLAAAWERFEATGGAHSQLYIGADLARLAVAGEDYDLAGRVAGRLEALAQGTGVPHVRGSALLARGLCDGDAERLEQAMVSYHHSGRAREAALAAELAGVALGGKRGRQLLDTALTTYEALGAQLDVARALAAGRSLGLGRGRRGARKRPETGWESLTPSELQVAQLAVEGLTNPQIGARLYISRRTVQTHLSHIFAKLGVASRVELAAFAARRQAS